MPSMSPRTPDSFEDHIVLDYNMGPSHPLWWDMLLVSFHLLRIVSGLKSLKLKSCVKLPFSKEKENLKKMVRQHHGFLIELMVEPWLVCHLHPALPFQVLHVLGSPLNLVREQAWVREINLYRKLFICTLIATIFLTWYFLCENPK